MWGIAGVAIGAAVVATAAIVQASDLPVKIDRINLSSLAVVTVAGWALIHWLRKHFATRDELNGVGARVTEWKNEMKEQIGEVKEKADMAERRSTLAKTEIARHGEHIEKHLIVPINKLTESIGAIREAQAAQVVINQQVEATLKEIRDALRRELS